MGIGSAADRIYKSYVETLGNTSQSRREFQQRLARVEALDLSQWDKLLADLLGPRRSDDLPWDPFTIIEDSFDMAQFQAYVRTVSQREEDHLQKIVEKYVASLFHRSNPGPFLRLRELPFCC